jgi:hypothetical protein
MNTATRYQAVRDAICELGPLATVDEIGEYLKRHHNYSFPDRHALSAYIMMVQKKMSRKPRADKLSPSGMFSFPGQ